MYKGDAFIHRMREWLVAKGVKTFGDLLLPGETEMRYRCKVHVVASDISRGNLVILPDDAPVYGLEPERLEVALAVRMSMSIPYFFTPVKVTNNLGQRCYIVDVITPGLMDTLLLHSVYGAGGDAVVSNQVTMLSGRRVGTADEVAQSPSCS